MDGMEEGGPDLPEGGEFGIRRPPLPRKSPYAAARLTAALRQGGAQAAALPRLGMPGKTTIASRPQPLRPHRPPKPRY